MPCVAENGKYMANPEASTALNPVPATDVVATWNAVIPKMEFTADREDTVNCTG